MFKLRLNSRNNDSNQLKLQIYSQSNPGKIDMQTHTAQVLKTLHGKDGKDYVLTEADRVEIAQLAAEMVDIPEIPEIPEGVATEDWVKDYAQPKGEYLTQSDLQSATDNALAQAKASGEFDGKDGADGKDGYTPVKGVDYFDGIDGINGSDGADGKTPVKGVDYFDGVDGKDGQNGKDGVSATHSWNGTTLTITSASGTSSANLKGDKGDKGDTGASGSNGTSVTVSNVTTSTADGGNNVVTFSDGKTVTIKNGSKGSAGKDGTNGSDGKDGVDGQRGFSILKVTTAPSSYTTATGGFTPTYRIALSTVKTQSKATEVLVGDTLAYSYYQYPIGYIDSSYVYLGTRVSIRGATGAAYTLTDTDKNTIVQAVLAEIESGDGVSY